MKKLSFAIALLLTAVMLFAACGSSEKIVAKVDDREITLEEFNSMLEYILYYYGLDVADASEEALSAINSVKEMLLIDMVNSEVVLKKAEELGLAQLTKTETDEVEAAVKTAMAEGKEFVEAQLRESHPDASDSEISLLLAVELPKQGYIEEDLRKAQTDTLVHQKLYDEIIKDIDISEQELQEGFDTAVDNAKASYADNHGAYENDAAGGSATYYIPDTTRQVQMILISISDEDIEEIDTLLTEEDQESVDAKTAEALESIKPKAEGVLADIKEDGSNFEDVMSENTDDPNLLDFPDGYYICKTDSAYGDSIAEAVFALEKPGDFTGLVPSDYGYYIIRYVAELQAGPVSLDSVREELKGDLLTTKENDTLTEKIEQWKSEMKVELYYDVAGITQTPEGGEADIPDEDAEDIPEDIEE